LRSEGRRYKRKNFRVPMLTSSSYKLVAMKLVSPSKEHLEKHYADLSEKPFFKGLVTCTPS
jgi:nucleoside diphosphate kinase